MRHVGHMDLQPVVTVLKTLHMHRVVEVARRFTVDRDDRRLAKIATSLQRLLAYHLRRGLGGGQYLLRESMRQMMLADNDFHVDTEIAGVPLPKGSLITICIGAANRDPEQFAAPDQFDIARAPNRHLAFASGAHVCAGLNLARMEGRVAIGRFIARFPNFEMAGIPLRARRVRFRGFTALPVKLG